MILRIHSDSGVPIYLQLVRQVIHAIETGVLLPGDQLPAIRSVAEAAVVNPNTVAKAYRELEYRNVIELRQGTGAFVRTRSASALPAETVRRARRIMHSAVGEMRKLELDDSAMRRILEAELTAFRDSEPEPAKRR